MICDADIEEMEIGVYRQKTPQERAIEREVELVQKRKRRITIYLCLVVIIVFLYLHGPRPQHIKAYFIDDKGEKIEQDVVVSKETVERLKAEHAAAEAAKKQAEEKTNNAGKSHLVF